MFRPKLKKKTTTKKNAANEAVFVVVAVAASTAMYVSLDKCTRIFLMNTSRTHAEYAIINNVTISTCLI